MSSKHSMKINGQTPTVRGQSVAKKSWLTSIALASTLFCLMPVSAFAAANLDAGADGQDSSNVAYPPTTGYIFTANNVDFTILNNVTIGNSPVFNAIDNGGFANDHIIFENNAIVNGNVGANFKIEGLEIGPGLIVFGGSILNQTPLNFHANGVAYFEGNNISITGAVDNVSSSYFPVGSLVMLGNTTLTGNIGGTDPIAGILAVNAGLNAEQQVILGPNITVNAGIIQAGIGGVVLPPTKFTVEDGTTVNGNFVTNRNDANLIVLKNNQINGNIGAESFLFNNVTVTPTKTANVNGNIYASSVVIANATLNISAGKSIFGPVDGALGKLTFLGTTSINEPIGATNALQTVTLDGPSGSVVTLNNDIKAGNVNMFNGTTLSVLGSDGPFLVGDALTVTNGSVVSLTPNAAIQTVAGNFSLNNTTTLNIDMAGKNAFTSPAVIAGSSAVLDPGATIRIINPGFSPNATTSSVAIRSIAGVTSLHDFVTSSLLTSVDSELANANKDLLLLVTSLPSQQFADQGNTNGVAGVLDSIALGPVTGSLQGILNQMGIFTDAQSLNNSLATLSPIVDGAITYESFNTQNAIFGTVGDRMDRMNFWRIHALSEEPQGVASGDSVTLDQGAWVKVYHQHGKQKIRNDIAGYSDHSWGITVGGDTMITNHSLIGASFSWTALDVNHDVSGSKTNANSFQGTMYSSVDFDCPLYVNAAVGVSYNNYITARNIVFNDLAIHPRGHFHGIQTGAKAEMGYVFGGQRYHAIPIASLYYSNLSLRGYQETGAGTASQIIRRQDYDTLLVGAGGKLVDDFPMSDNYLLQSEVHAMMFYDLFNDNVQTTSQFVGAGASFNTIGFKPVRDSYNIGASLILFSHYSFNLSAEYDYNFKVDYRANSGFVRVRYEFL